MMGNGLDLRSGFDMKWLAVGNEIHVMRGYERVAVFARDEMPDLILAMCKVLKNDR